MNWEALTDFGMTLGTGATIIILFFLASAIAEKLWFRSLVSAMIVVFFFCLVFLLVGSCGRAILNF